MTYMQPKLDSLRIKIFADGADRKAMVELYRNPRIKGFTTNPTLMRKDGVGDYENFAREVLAVIRDRPISVFCKCDLRWAGRSAGGRLRADTRPAKPRAERTAHQGALRDERN